MATLTKVMSVNSFTATLEYKENSTSTSNNTSNVTATLKLSSNKWGSFYGYTTSGTISINGTNYSVSTSANLETSSTITIGSKTVDVGHNNDGTKTINIGFSISNGYAGSASNSTSWNLSNIARFANLTIAGPYTDEDDITITVSNPAKATNLRGWLEINPTNTHYAERSITLDSSNKFTWNLTETERNQLRACLPKNTSGKFRIGLYSTIGSTTGSNYKDTTYNIVNANPEQSISKKETNANVTKYLGTGATTVIKNISQVEITSTPTAKKQATITNVNINGVDKSVSPYKATIVPTSNVFTITAMDSRGLTNTKAETVTLIDYEPVLINKQEIFKRVGPTSSNVTVKATCTYYQKTFGSTANKPTITWNLKYIDSDGQEKTKSGTITTYTIDSSKNTLTIDTTLNNVLDYRNIGTFSLTVSDLLSSNTNGNDVLKGIPTYDAGEHDLKVNGQLYIANIDGQNKSQIVESTTEDNKTCIKYYDGTMIQTIQTTYTGTITTTWGGTYITGTVSLPDYKEEFINKPVIHLTVEAGNNSDVCMIMSDGTPTKTNPGKFRLIRGASLTSSRNFVIYVTAIGRWK